MADTGMAETLKTFAQRITSSSVNERRKILGDLLPCVKSAALPEPAVKGILKHLLLTLPRYYDGKSRRAVCEVIQALSTSHLEVTLKYMIPLLTDLAENINKQPASSSNSGIALSALTWTTQLVQNGFKTADKLEGSLFRKLVQVQVLLVSGALAASKTKFNAAVYNRFKRSWKEMPGSLEKYSDAMVNADPNLHNLCMIGIIMKFLQQNRDQENIQNLKPKYIDQYVKTLLGGRTKPPTHILDICHHLLRHIDHSTFKELVIPAVDRAMLRNPEIILEAYTSMLAGVTIDLSQYGVELAKYLATHCHSMQDEMRNVAVLGCKHLARQLSDPTAVTKIVKHFFSVLNGSEGKLSVTAQRLSLLAGIGNLSYNTVSGAQSVHSVTADVTELFIPVLQQEVHEGTLLHTLEMYSLWCSKFTTDVPTKVAQWFKTGFGLKSSTAVVRTAYIQCMASCYQGDKMLQALDLVPVLLQTLEKAASQPTQVALVAEAVSAAAFLAKLSTTDIQAENKLEKFWPIVTDENKQLFVSDKFLTSLNDDGLQALATLVERLTLDHHHRLSDKTANSYYKCLVYALTHGSYASRKCVASSVKKIISVLGGSKVALSILKQFHLLLQSQSLSEYEKELEQETPDMSRFISPRILATAFLTIAMVPNADARDAEMIALDTLLDAHHPSIMFHNSDIWTDIIFQLKIDAAEFIEAHVDDIVDDLKNLESLSQCHCGAVSTLVRISPKCLLPRIIELITSALRNSSLHTVTRKEYEIMLHPEGELYDKSVIESGSNKEEQISNMKRENKLYSYEEQLAEIELKKELEKKKAQKSGGKNEPKLTKKQQEAMAAQLVKESEIRVKAKQLDVTVERALAFLSAVVAGNPHAVRTFMPTLLRCLVSLMPSPLASPRATKALVGLKDAAFIDADVDLYFGDLIANCTIRLLKPSCYLEKAWTDEPLKSQTLRAVNMIHSSTVSSRGAIVKKEPFSAPSFAYCFYLLKTALENGGEAVNHDQATMLKILNVISTHAQLRTKDPLSNEIDQNGPDLLPREEMLRLCAKAVATSSGNLQQTAAQALLDVAGAGSGNPGCAIAQQGEVFALLDSLQAPSSSVREAALQALLLLEEVLPTPDVDRQVGVQVAKRVWMAKFDVDPECVKLANRLWAVCELEVAGDMCEALVEDIVHDEDVVRAAAADALAAAVDKHKQFVHTIVEQLIELYDDKLYLPPPILDNFGRVISEAPPDQWPARVGIAMALEKLSPDLEEDQIDVLFTFMVEKALGDRHENVRKHMLQASVTAINDHGKSNVNLLLPVFEEFLKSAPDQASYDAVRQSVVILMGSLAKHLNKDDPKVKPIVAKLIETLSTPSQPVQEAVANCLPPLVPAVKEEAPHMVRSLLHLLLDTENYGERKGAAYGLAGMVKGLGILALKQLDIMSKLTDAIQDKKNPRYREGALFAFEMLCVMLGRLFEPYVVHILPHLLLCFGDPNQYVREAADECAKAVMSKLSGHGVKLVLPSLLTAIEEDSWRTKTGSVELLGAMAFCAPKQLSACLPSIVPKLTEVLTDSHLKVQKAGAQALKQIGSVIRNPEIQAIVPNLLVALQDPTKRTTTCLTKLLETKFVHFIDAPSLALIMPVVQRAFQDRSTETRKMAAQIIGNMYSLTDQKDLAPYLPAVIPGLKQSLLDPVPEVRSVSARALGAMVKGMGESGFEELVPWLMATLTSENNSVDRSGAAQGLSEVVGGLGLEKLSKLMPDIIQTAERPDIASHVRDGYIMMYIYLPNVFGDEFMPYVGPIIPSILQALADENEYVRDTALRAGQRIVNMYADTAIELLLPELEKGLFDDNWRIRYSSVQLLGDLLYLISGVSGKMTTESAGEDDNFGTETSQKAILRTLGEERRNRVLAGLYMGRSDTALLVRQAALHVWKVIVTHTPKTLREILPTLFSLLLGCLASTSYDKRQVAARTLGDIVRKLGEKVLPEIIPILEEGLESEDSDQRQGVCIGLSEIMSSTSREHVVVFADSLIPTVRKALVDPLPAVREAAAQTFDNLHTNIGTRALDEILPFLLEQLDADDEMKEHALDGLKQVMAVKSRVVLPHLVPVLTKKPVNTRALSFFSAVAGDSLTKHLNKILPALLSALSEKRGTEHETEELGYCQSVVLCVQDELGMRVIIDELLQATSHAQPGVRWAAVIMLHSYCDQTKADYSEYVTSLMRGIVRLFTDTDEKVLHAAWDCLNSIQKKLDPSEQMAHIQSMRQAVRFAVSDLGPNDDLPGFCLLKKGITPILPIYREGILNGPPELKEQAAVGLGEAIKRTSAPALKPSVVNITGPLIRILGDRFSYGVKVAVLETLACLLSKCGVMLKPFLPQLQTTFIKALNDPNRAVRIKAASALSELIIIHPRPDPLIAELHAGIKVADDAGIRDTMLAALRGVIAGAGSKLTDKVRREVVGSLEDYLAAGEDGTRAAAAACLGTLAACVSSDDLAVLVNMQLLDTDTSVDWTLRHGRAVGLSVAMKCAAERLTTPEYEARVTKAITVFCAADRVPICLAGLRALGFLFKHYLQNGTDLPKDLVQLMVKAMKADSNDVKGLAAQIVSYLSKSCTLPAETLRTLVPMLVNGTKEKNTVVKVNSELALVSALRLRDPADNTYQNCLASLEPGMRDSLTEVYTKALKKVASQPDIHDDEIDDTVLV